MEKERLGMMLPVNAGREKIVARIKEHDTVILVGETGSGKTTQVPQFLLDAVIDKSGHAILGITQPRRVAATSLARRVASEMGCADPAMIDPKHTSSKPELVGYSVRFDDRTNRNTRIKFMTDGMLIREILGPVRIAPEKEGKTDPLSRNALLNRYRILIIDEAHERSLRTDMLLGLLKEIQQERRRLADSGKGDVLPLKLVIMSATIDAELFAGFFQTANKLPPPILYVAGRQHGVRIFHSNESCQDWTDAAVRTVMQIHVSKPLGDILVFATGQEEIESLSRSIQLFASQLEAWAHLEGREDVPALLVRPLYAALGQAASAAVFAPTPADTRKVVIATNIAETSITIPGVRYVVDSGLVKEKIFSPQTGIETLQVLPISQSSSLQRAGRAGREAPGECYRLYTKSAFDSLQKMPVPEIHRTELSGGVLQLYAIHIDPFTFQWLDPPDTALLQEAVVHLAELGAIQSQTIDGKKIVRLTPLGRKLAILPITPSYARLLVAAADRGPTTARQARDLVSILSADRGVFVESHDADRREAAERARETFLDPSGDHATMLNALYGYITARNHAQHSHADGLNGHSAKHELRMWCQTHAIHERTMRNILAIRKQLIRICQQNKIVCDDETSTKSSESASLSAAEDVDDGEEDLLTVTRFKPISASSSSSAENYTDLLQCLGLGRLSNVALLQPDRTYRRVSGGLPFKLHPASTLHPAYHKARGTSSSLVQAIVFEELALTSQTFARTVSRLEPAWLQDLIGASHTMQK
ncbi:RNA helicase [Malassezia psittaci]|uniref:RNA helicase n=1 Tax=Malassezia psittaci TaxID=1821823 RepID=A0AAF0F9J0_9BASI|nr:RNA helicase [Malassezia psittaci]